MPFLIVTVRLMEKIAVIIVTFNPELNKLKNLISGIKMDTTEVIIIDNNSHNYKLFNFGCNQISLDKNVGIAKAQNIGILKAKELECRYILFLDQDSNLGKDFVSNIYKEYLLAEIRYNNIVIGPIFYDDRFNFEYPQIIFNKLGIRRKIMASEMDDSLIEVSCIISSGMFTSLSTLYKVGLMDEGLFIDYVDTEWCFRAINKGINIFVCNTINMKHEIGDDNIKFFKWRVPVHKSQRRFYRIRNSFYLFKYPHINKIISLRETMFSIFHQLILIFMYKDKIENTKVLFSAVLFGLNGIFRKDK